MKLKTIVASILALSYTTIYSQETTVYLKDFLSPEEAATDAMPAIRKALETVKEKNASSLVLPGGMIRIRPEKAFEQYLFISNNDESLKRIAFQLDGFSGLTIDGNGTSLLFSGFISPFNLSKCNDITIKDLDIDFVRTFHSEGVITSSFNGGIDVRFPDEYKTDIVNGFLRFSDDEGVVYPYSNMLEFDGRLREPAHYATDIWLQREGVMASRNEDGSFRITGDNKKGKPGNVMVFGAASRYNPGFTLSDCSGITIEDVNLYHCGGMGVIAQRSRDILLDGLRIVPAPGKDRMVSITADATHFVNCAGYIKMIDCEFRNQKDDATNIHGLYMVVDEVISPTSLLLCWRNTGQYGVDFIKEGMTLELVDNEDLNTYARRKVKKVTPLNKVYTEVEFTEPLPEGVKEKHVLAADDEYPEVLIKGCTFAGNRARGLLLGSHAPMVVEDCYFHIPGAAILLEGDGNYWFEQSGVRNLTIRNNTFENCNYGSPHWGKACISVGSGIPKKGTSRYNRNIKISGNTFRVFDPRIINVYCTDGLIFTEDNKIEMNDDYTYGQKEKRHFIATDSDNISFPRE